MTAMFVSVAGSVYHVKETVPMQQVYMLWRALMSHHGGKGLPL